MTMLRDRRSSRGFTLIELLVVIAIMAILVALLLPAVQQAREAARRASCKNNLLQLNIALQNYYDAHESLPSGCINPTGPIRSVPQGELHHSWITLLLPFIEEGNLYNQIDLNVSAYDPKNAAARERAIPVILCPSDRPGLRQGPARNGDGARGLASYAGVHHPTEAPIDVTNHGVLFLNSGVRYEGIPDGSSHTLFLGEFRKNATDLGWISGTASTLRNAGAALNDTPFGSPYYNDPFAPPPPSPQPVAGPAGAGATGAAGLAATESGAEAAVSTDAAAVAAPPAANDPALTVGGFGSPHSGGGHFAVGDGAVRFLSENIDPVVYTHLADRADGVATGDF